MSWQALPPKFWTSSLDMITFNFAVAYVSSTERLNAASMQQEVLNRELNTNVQFRHIIYDLCSCVFIHTQARCIIFFGILPIATGNAVRYGQRLYPNISNFISLEQQYLSRSDLVMSFFRGCGY